MFRRSLLVAVVMGAPFLSGCYTYVPVDTAAPPPVGKRLALDISDRGRVGLSDRLGAGVLRIEGTVAADDTATYVMNVYRVEQLNTVGGQQWTGEQVRIDRDYVSRTFERQLNHGKTYLVGGVAVAAVVLFMRSQGLIGAADVTNGGDPGQPPPSSSRVIPW